MDFGVYTIPSRIPGTTLTSHLARRRSDLRAIAQAGLNTMHCEFLGKNGVESFLDLANDLSVGVIFEGVSAGDLQSFSGHPALKGINIADDANLKPLDLITTTANNTLSSPRYLSMFPAYNNSQSQLYGLTEMVGVQSYVFGYSENLYSSYVIFKAARENADRTKSRVFANTQLHSIGGGLPTIEQVRAQTWLAAICKLDGIIAYTYVVGDQFVDPAIWKSYIDTCKEIRLRVSGPPLSVYVRPDNASINAQWRGGIDIGIDLVAGRVTYLTKRNL